MTLRTDGGYHNIPDFSPKNAGIKSQANLIRCEHKVTDKLVHQQDLTRAYIISSVLET